MGTAIWLAVLAGLWAVVLTPFFRSSRDSVAGLRSIDHFHSAMRVLSRRDDRNRRLVVLPPGARTGRVGLPVVNNAVPRTGPSAAQRRARTFGVIVSAALVFSGAAVVTRGFVWVVAAVFSWVALVLCLAWLRSSARAAAAARRRRGPRPQAAPVAPAWSPATGPFAVVAPSAAALAMLPRPAGAPAISQELPVLRQPAPVPAQPVAYVPPPAVHPSEVTAADVAPEEWREWTEEPFAGVRVLDLTTPGGWRRRRLFESALDEAPEIDFADDEVPIRARRSG